MAKKKPTKKDKKTPAVNDSAERGTDAALAKATLTPTVQAAGTTQRFGVFGNETADFVALVDELGLQVKAVQEGKLIRPEAMLVAQAHTLDAIFNSLARRSAANMGEYMDAAETYMKLALKAQSQCRTTIEALSEVKNPRHVAFVKQANIAHNQQVNNGASASAETSRAGRTPIEQNKLLEQNDGKQLDTGTTGTAGGVDSPLEAVGAVHRTKDG